jgi:hypothetical protein
MWWIYRVPSVHAGSARCLSNAVVGVAAALSGECASALTVPTHKNGRMSTAMSRRMLRTATMRSPRSMLEITPSGNGFLSVLYPTISSLTKFASPPQAECKRAQDGAMRSSAPFRGGIPYLYCGHYTFVNGIGRQELLPAMRRHSRETSFARDSAGRYREWSRPSSESTGQHRPLTLSVQFSRWRSLASQGSLAEPSSHGWEAI